jgi:archaellum component FlaC
MTTVAGNRGGAGVEPAIDEENPAFEFAQRTSKKIIDTLTEENTRLWERVKELQREVEVLRRKTDV